MACTGIEFCKLAIVETKERAIRLVEDLEKRLADVHPDVPISIHLNGCPNACARTQVADIGLKGQIVTDADGDQVEGFQVHLGGGLGLDAGFGRKLRGLKVTSAELGEYVERLVRRFDEQRDRRRAVRAVGAAGRRGGAEVIRNELSARCRSTARTAARRTCARPEASARGLVLRGLPADVHAEDDRNRSCREVSR